jgi:hypothetical protein
MSFYTIKELPIADNRKMSAYICCQRTPLMVNYIKEQKYQEMVVSNPAFNRPIGENKDLENVNFINLPVFGLKIPNLVYRIFSRPEFASQMESMNMKLNYGIDKSLATPQFFEKLGEISGILALVEGTEQVCQNIQRYGEMIQRVCTNDEVKSYEQWVALVSEFVPDKYKNTWHEPQGLFVDKLLLYFGLNENRLNEVHEVFMMEERKKKAKKGNLPVEQVQTKLGETVLRWLAKFMSAYSLTGCLTDFVNLVEYMVYGVSGNNNRSETEICQMLQQVLDNPFEVKYLPAEIVLDGEVDDRLCVAFVRTVTAHLGKKVRIVFQVPLEDNNPAKYASVVDKINPEHVIYDPESRNGKKLFL